MARLKIKTLSQIIDHKKAAKLKSLAAYTTTNYNAEN